MKIRHIILLLILILTFNLNFSQNWKNNFFPPSPESAALIKQVDIPVNNSTGVISYTIPIHDIKLKDLTIPISLSYQSSGFKPNEVASNTGLGWELIAGGKITQNIIGGNDLDNYGFPSNELNLVNDRDYRLPWPSPFPSNVVTPAIIHYNDSIKGPNTDYTLFNKITGFKTRNYITGEPGSLGESHDAQPDLFYFSCPSKSGKFFFSDGFLTHQIPFGTEKIIYNSSGFTITDNRGIKYFYNKIGTSINRMQSTSPNPIHYFNTSLQSNSYIFYLTKIMTPSNEEVSFTYEPVKYTIVNNVDYTRFYHEFYGGFEKKTKYFSEVNCFILKKIEISNYYELNFEYNNYRKDIKGQESQSAPKSLDKITVKDHNVTNTYTMQYDYYNRQSNVTYNHSLFEGSPSESNENSELRLKLVGVQKNNEEAYRFEYYNESSPDRISDCTDHWSYHSSNCKRYTTNFLFNDFSNEAKESSFEETRSNMLKQITLPTKGSVKFDYELNDVYTEDIKYNYVSIPHSLYANDDDIFDNEAKTQSLTFMVPQNHVVTPIISYNVTNGDPQTTSNFFNVSIVDNRNNNIPILNSFKNGINSEVFLGNPFFEGTYTMTINYADTPENSEKFFTIKFVTKEIEISAPHYDQVGGLRIKNIITIDNDNLDVLSKKVYNYIDDDGRTSGILYEKPQYFDLFGFVTEHNENQHYASLEYKVQNSKIPYELFGFDGYHVFYKKVTETLKDTQNLTNEIKTEKYFTFEDDLRYGEGTIFSKISYNWKRGMIKKINEFKGNDTIRKLTNSYRFLETPYTKFSTLEPGLFLGNPTQPNEFHQRSIYASVIQTAEPNWWNFIMYSSSKLISSWFYKNTEVKEENFNGKTLSTKTDYIYNNPTNAQLSKSITTFPDSSTIETFYSYAHEKGNQKLIDANMVGFPLETKVKKNGVTLSKTETKYEHPGNLFPSSVLSTDHQSVATTEVTYDQYDSKGNILQYTTKDGVPTTIIWGYGRTQPIAKIVGAGYPTPDAKTGEIPQSLVTVIVDASDIDAELSKNSDESVFLAALDGFRNDARLKDYQVTTYTYDPLLGVRSITPPSGIREYYVYDDANRLKEVRDADGKILKSYEYHYKP